MNQIVDLIVEYHKKLNDFVSSGITLGDNFFELEDEILQYFDLVPPDTYYYQSALQMKMAKIGAPDAEGKLKELSDFMIPLRNRIDGQVWICDPKLIYISSVTKNMYDMLIEYEEMVLNEDEECLYASKPATLHFDDPSQVKILLDTYGFNANEILAKLDAMQEANDDKNEDYMIFENLPRNYDSVSKCMVCAVIDTYFGTDPNLVPPHDVLEVWTGYFQFEETMNELFRTLYGEVFQAVWLPRLKAYVLDKDFSVQSETVFYMVLFAFKDALSSISSDLISSRYFYRLVHQYLLKRHFYLLPETVNNMIERIMQFTRIQGKETQL